MNERAYLMPWVEAFAYVHNGLGGGIVALAVMHVALCVTLYFFLKLCLAASGVKARWPAVVFSYLLTGFSTIGVAFYAITPAMNLWGVAYLTAIWPLWIYMHVGVPEFIAPFLFTF